MAVPKSFQVSVILVFLCCSQIVRSEMFTALVELQKVLHTEHDIAQDLKKYITNEEQRIEKLKAVVEDYESHSREALADVDKHLANPVNAFLLVKRFTTDWNKVEDLIKNNRAQEILGKIEAKSQNFPQEEDLNGAANALLRLQDTYALETSKLARGEIKGVKSSPVLTAEECFELGKIAYNSGDHYHCILWMTHALEIWETEMNKTINKAMLFDYVSYSIYVQGNTRYALNLTNQWLELEPDHTRANNNKKYYIQMIEDEEKALKKKGDEGAEDVPIEDVPVENLELKNERPLDDYRKSKEFATYEALCRGEETTKYALEHKLYCRLNTDHPIFKIRPLKMELMYFDPKIYIFHDLLADSEIEKIKELAAPRLARSGVFTLTKQDSGISKSRVSKSAWLADNESYLIKRVSQKSGASSGLTLDTAELLQVVNYGIGGHYEPHYDFARPEEITTFDTFSGNRIATVIYYLTDVEAGGATVFPEIGVKLWPEKGACAFWYNLMANGDGDYLTRHAGCPVLTGSKWVSNKWIHERGQEFVRPCTLNPKE